MGLRYEVYGLQVEADRQLAGMRAGNSGAAVDLRITFGGTMPGEVVAARPDAWVRCASEADDEEDAQTHVFEQAGRKWVRFRYLIDAAWVDFVVDGEGANVWVTHRPDAAADDVASLLLGPVLGRALRLRGVPCLHASAVAIDGRAYLLVGSRGAGKSTTAAGLAAGGAQVLSDDLAPLERTGSLYRVHPGCPRLRLWNPAISAFVGSREVLPRVLSNRNKRFLDLATDGASTRWRFCDEALPVAAIYVLGARHRTSALPAVRELTPSEGLRLLVANSYAHHLLARAARADEFAFLSDLVRSVPVRRVDRPDAMDTVPALCDAIRDDVARQVTAMAGVA